MWPTYQTVEYNLSDRDVYTWRYGRLKCRIWLTPRGRFMGQIDKWAIISEWNVREVLDKMYNLIPRGSKW